VKRARAACAAALAAAGALAATAGAGTAPPRCAVAVELETDHAFVGQQVHYRLRILRRRDVVSLEWETPLSFPTFRAEWLPGVAADDRIEREGETYLVFVERRALFPAHPGRLTVPGASLRCASADGEEIAPIPALSLQVDALPEEGRPPGFGGLIGPVDVSASVAPERLSLGGSLRLSVVVQGASNVWTAESPKGALERLPGVEVFERPAEMARDTGRTLVLRRYLSFDLVPHAAGALRLPDVRVPYFDPVERRYAEARAFVPAVEVVEAPVPDVEDEARPPEVAPTQRPSALPRSALAAFAAALAAAAVAWRWVRRASRRDAAERILHGSLPGDEAAAAARALRLSLATDVPGAPSLSAEEILDRLAAPGPARDAALLLERIERARFAAGATRADLDEVERALAGLRRAGR
jgi:hypothetical protein